MIDGAEGIAFACLAVVVLTTLIVSTTTAVRHNDRVGRLWSTGFLAGIATSGLVSAWPHDHAAPRGMNVVLGGAVVLTTGALWAGTALLNERGARLPIVALAVAAAAAAPLGAGSAGGSDLGRAVMLGLAGVFACLCAAELGALSSRASPHSRILRVALWSYGVWSVVLGGAVAAGDGARDRAAFDLGVVVPLTFLLVTAAVCLSVMQAERSIVWSAHDATGQTGLQLLDLVAFDRAARDRLDRAAPIGAHQALVLIDVDDLAEINRAFGRESGDDALRHVSAVLRTHVPPAALIGHQGAGRFVVLTSSGVGNEGAKIVAAIRRGLIDSTTPQVGVRVMASYGTSSTTTCGHDLDRLLSAARGALSTIRDEQDTKLRNYSPNPEAGLSQP